MSKVKRLDLSGISLADLSRKRPRQEFRIAPEATAPIDTGRKFPVRSGIACIAILLIVGLFVNLFSGSSMKSAKRKYTGRKSGLRRIIRMQCQTKRDITYCTTSEVGDYIVSIGKCKDVYEFNGIPFTELKKNKQGNYIVPGSLDMNLRIKDACQLITASVDTTSNIEHNYATNGQGKSGNINRLIWVADTCYKDFTVKIDNEIIYEDTPTSMINKVKLTNKTAYIYKPDVDYLSGPVHVHGSGCTSPIIIYTLRE